MANNDRAHNIRHKALQGVAWTTIDRWAGKLISMASFIVLARLLSPNDFGLIAITLVYINFIEIFVSQGLGFAIVQRDEVTHDHLDTVFWLNVAIGVIGAAGSFLLAEPIAHLLDSPDAAPVLQVMALALLLTAFTRLQAALLTREMRFASLALRNLAASLAGGIAGVTLALLHWGVWSLVVQQLTAATVGLAVLWAASHWRPRFTFSMNACRELYGFSFKVLLDSLCNFVIKRLDDLIIGVALGTTLLGDYSVAKRLIGLMQTLFLSTLSAVTFPAFSRARSDPEKTTKGFRTATRLAAVVLVPVFFGIAALAPQITHLFFGEKWLSSAPIMAVLAVAMAIEWFNVFCSAVLYANARPGTVLLTNGGRLLLTFIILPFGVFWGVIGVAGAVGIRNILSTTGIVWATVKMIPLLRWRDILLAVGPPLICALAMAAAARVIAVWAEPSLGVALTTLLAVVTGMGVYALGLMLVRPELLREVFGVIGEVLRAAPIGRRKPSASIGGIDRE